ncbi:putative GPI-anchored protein pfl2 isoform X1 [Oryzias melastigma]|uniref:putative GPI-anchored protein pfl2 isoform X1 n=1 Tax=Oryzias melastigma TaxID=30732 RepID=UPI000CF8123A|nr:putative GPI-anchored protein pfl2 isoform X1 [Oryzias melastigma]XP_036071998.1 putative GPI-anchored protein pfl2 isoform X1 [Oryzias melastigma]
MMAVTNLMKVTGFLHLLLVGFLLPPSLVSGQNSTTSTNSTSSGSQSTSATQLSSSSSTMVQSSSVTPSSQSTATSTNSVMASSSSASGGSTGSNWTSGTNYSSDMLYCPSFTCSYSQCYSKYSSENATSCSSNYNCQLLRTADMQYNVSCSSSCAMSCVNSSDTNCSVKCCNSTGCLNDTFASMMTMTTAGTAISTITTTRAPQPTTAIVMTTTNNGNKCVMGTCMGETCYSSFNRQNFETCTSSKPNCQLKKETVNSAVQWTAGCANCTGSPSCTASTQPPCFLECCIASKTSCLMLNGTLNVPSFAVKGPHTQLITYLLCVISSAALFFIL